MVRCRIGIVIPAFNEALNIASIVKAVILYGIPIVVDDASTDCTAALAARNGAIVVTHEYNGGYDRALSSGFKKAAEMGLEMIVSIDADGQHDPSLLQRFIDEIDRGSDIVVGVRSRRQRFSENLFAFYTNSRFGIRDPLCGMKAYRMSVYKWTGHFDSYKSIGTELMLVAVRNGFIISQVEFSVRDRVGASRFGNIISGNYKIIRSLILSFFY